MKTNQMRSALLNILTGNETENERRNFSFSEMGGVLVPKEVYNEFVGKEQSDNLLRKYGTIIKGANRLEVPVITNDAEAVAHSEEYNGGQTVKVNNQGVTAEYLVPNEFDCEASIRKQLLKQNKNNQELLFTLLKNAYKKKEKDFMYNGTDANAENKGSLYNRAKLIETTETEPVKIIKEIRNAASSTVRENARWIINTKALDYVENLVLENGEPVLKTVPNTSDDGVGAKYLLLGFPCDVTDDIKAQKEENALFYFGDLSSFFIYEDENNFEINGNVEEYAMLNEVGFRLFYLLDGKLIYSEKEITIFKSEITI
ncbi:phage major capsid protein [Enterococcus faecalis]|uniref:phage major capsid protein n=1 Tax=Enterococcus faecalis TaxID=1351 RepID=UPI0001B2E77E|nr:phage major capsid protein [Enterococcus faecalis]EEU79979.1 prohead protease [Enterococcus faecalis Fly1]EGO7617906.1 phage major capsid protein [Enterococcus faecalis]EGO7913060.1 phage major capsid protein [Enterococcus faecalis]EHZ2968484.1 phage major capsid protein [Enterococcus faecalis]EIB6795291.1 phage major capsid protein [Enterococcus faecalis]